MGYRQAALIVGGIILAVHLVCAIFLAKGATIDLPGMTRAEGMKSRWVWVVLVGIIIISLSSGYGSLKSAVVVSKGFTTEQTGTIVSIASVVAIFASLLWGVLIDKLGLRKALVIIYVCAVVALLCSLGNSYIMMVAFLAIYAANSFLATTSGSHAIKKVVAMKDVAYFTGMVGLLKGLGGAISSPIIGSIYDATGSYSSAGIVCIVFVTLGVTLLLFGIRETVAKY